MSKEINKERVERLAEHIAKQVFDLAKDYLPRIENAGSESEKGEAKVTFAASWPAYHHSPSVVTKLSFSTSTKDETESRIDLEQTSMDFGGDDPEPEKRELLAIEGKVLDADGWVDAGDRLPDDETLVEIEDVDSESFRGRIGVDKDFGGTVFNCEDGGFIQVAYIVRWRLVDAPEAEDAPEADPEIVKLAAVVLDEFRIGENVLPSKLQHALKTNYDEAERVYEYLYERGRVNEAGMLTDAPEGSQPAGIDHPFESENGVINDAGTRKAIIDSADANQLEMILGATCGSELQKTLRKRAEKRLEKLREEESATV